MKDQTITRDERTTAVENASYRTAYVVLSFGLLLVASYRSWAWNENTFDLLALVVLGGVVATFNQGMHKVLLRRYALLAVVCALLAGVVAAAITIFR